MSEISREELIAFTEAHARVSVALDKISERLADVLKNQDKIIGSLTADTLAAKVADAVSVATATRLEASSKEINDTLTTKLPGTLMEKINGSDIAKDVDHAKMFLGILTLVIIVTTVLLKFFFNAPIVTQDQIRAAVKQELKAINITVSEVVK